MTQIIQPQKTQDNKQKAKNADTLFYYKLSNLHSRKNEKSHTQTSKIH